MTLEDAVPSVLARLRARPRAWTRVLKVLHGLGLRPALAGITLGLIALVGCLAVGLLRGTPLPRDHDEFSYLLAGDTFADGRLSNPAHRQWHHFETFHVIHEPTYQSKYPPGQGLVLAAGQKIGGHPVWGVWLTAAMLAAVLPWALLGWLPPAWAVLGATVGTVQLSLLSYWAQSYWGGMLAAMGGAMVFGALPRLRRNPKPLTGISFGVGLGLLAISRPLEGFLLAMLVAVPLFRHMWAEGSTVFGPMIRRGLLPAVMTLLPFLGFLAVYNRAVTGNPLEFPYRVHEANYSAAPSLLTLKPGPPPPYRHPEIERYWLEWGRDRHIRERSFPRVLARIPQHLGSHLTFFLGPALFGLIGLRFSQLRRHLGVPFLVAVVLFISVLNTKGAFTHYLAPAAVPILVLAAGGLMSLHRNARRTGTIHSAPWIMAGTVLTWAITCLLIPASAQEGFPVERATLSQALRDLGGDHLILVSYTAGHNYHEEWVQNEANIEGSRIVWARSMDPEADSSLIDHFANRRVWSLLIGPGRSKQLEELAAPQSETRSSEVALASGPTR